jgi:hypothetical protein
VARRTDKGSGKESRETFMSASGSKGSVKDLESTYG